MNFYLVIYKQEKVKDEAEILNYHVLDTLDFDINIRGRLEKSLMQDGFFDIDDERTLHNMIYMYIDGNTEYKFPFYLKLKSKLIDFIRNKKLDELT